MRAMRRRRLAWLLSLALMAIGGLFAHILAYRLVAPHPARHEELLSSSGHGYHAHWAVCFAVCATVALIGLARVIVDRARGQKPLRLPLWVFGVLPPAGFVVQEHLERFLHTGTFPYAASLEATFLVGILLQIPFALAAFALARILLTFAEILGSRLGAASRPRLAPLTHSWEPSSETRAPRLPVLAPGHGPRAPPAPLSP
jgi:hypothetical protein